jgi:tetratricopeptide (TPR) repeat protein
MEDVSRALDDQTLLNTAHSYQRDMYRRGGDIEKAITYLEAARDLTPLADPAARGNAIQLLGRAYLPAKNIPGFEYAMAQAEELGHQVDAQTNSIQGHFNLGTVYEEYAKSYASLGQTQKAMDYTNLTEATLPKTKNNEVLLMIVRAEALIYSGEIDLGKPLAIEAARMSRMQGHQRRLERIYKIKKHMHEQALKLTKMEMELSGK